LGDQVTKGLLLDFGVLNEIEGVSLPGLAGSENTETYRSAFVNEAQRVGYSLKAE